MEKPPTPPPPTPPPPLHMKVYRPRIHCTERQLVDRIARLGIAGMVPGGDVLPTPLRSAGICYTLPKRFCAVFAEYVNGSPLEGLLTLPAPDVVEAMTALMTRVVPDYDHGMFSVPGIADPEAAMTYSYAQDAHHWLAVATAFTDNGRAHVVETYDAAGRLHSVDDVPAQVHASGLMVWYWHGARWRRGGRPGAVAPSWYAWYHDDGSISNERAPSEPHPPYMRALVAVKRIVCSFQSGPNADGTPLRGHASVDRQCYAPCPGRGTTTLHRDDGLPAVWNHWEAHWLYHGRQHREDDLPSSVSMPYFDGLARESVVVTMKYSRDGRLSRPHHDRHGHNAPTEALITYALHRCQRRRRRTAAASLVLSQRTVYLFRRNGRLRRDHGLPAAFSVMDTSLAGCSGAVTATPPVKAIATTVTLPCDTNTDHEQAIRPETVLPPWDVDPRRFVVAHPCIGKTRRRRGAAAAADMSLARRVDFEAPL